VTTYSIDGDGLYVCNYKDPYGITYSSTTVSNDIILNLGDGTTISMKDLFNRLIDLEDRLDAMTLEKDFDMDS